MKKTKQLQFGRRAFTLLELTVVMAVLISLMGTGLFVSKKMGEWRLGRAASESLREVYSAQRMFLSDNPTRLVSSITSSDVIPYLPGGAAALPTVKSLTGAQLGILVNVSPPIINNGSGVAYDPSGNSRDSLWDVGE
jgi:prepilin-type N-terminal cleavage/methylation domain-containing protein